MTQIRLGQSDSVYSNNVENSVHVNLEQRAKLLPYTEVEDVVNLYDVYNAERDASRNYRLTFTLSPVCTNILYNMRTEVVQNEGAGNCVALVRDDDTATTPSMATNQTTLDRKQAIRDTEYSHENVGNFKYHCGLDMLNNHKLRTNDFMHINKVKADASTDIKNIFNTMWDIKRDFNGEVVIEQHADSDSTVASETHIYQLDNILSFEEAFRDKIVSRDGWYGFVNKAGINIPSAQVGADAVNLYLNKIIQYNKPCEIYNLYPDKSLYSFIPKINKHRRRLEYNWDYVLTYPYSSDTETFNWINQNVANAIKITKKGVWNPNGNRGYIWFTTLMKHNLQVNDRIRIYYGGNGMNEYSYLLRVVRIGDANGENLENCFMIDEWGNEALENEQLLFFKKETNGVQSQYYIRQFKKLQKQTNNGVRDYASQIGKLAYAENIYGDPMAQIIYTDTINTEGLVDNLGRDVSEIYLTIVKTNRGHNKWYSSDSDRYTSGEIEFSHCFGEVTSGFDLGDEQADYNIRKLHNIRRTGDADIEGLWTAPTPLERDITVGSKSVFYGDIVEFNPANYTETVLEPVYHRFNTAQREYYKDDALADIFDDELIGDDYDEDGFEIETTNINTNGAYGNLQPEGYFYNPHYKIQLRKVESVPSTNLAHKILLEEGTAPSYSSSGENYFVTFTPSNKYEYLINDAFAFYNYATKKVAWGVVDSISGDTLTVRTVVDLSTWVGADYDIILTDGSVPYFATYLPISETFVWRDTVLPSADLEDDSTFANGCFYINSNINLFLRRQDPTNKYGLMDIIEHNSMGTKSSPTRKYKYKGAEIALKALQSLIIDVNFSCV